MLLVVVVWCSVASGGVGAYGVVDGAAVVGVGVNGSGVDRPWCCGSLLFVDAFRRCYLLLLFCFLWDLVR